LFSEASRSKGGKRCNANLQRMDILLLSRSLLASRKKKRRLKLISFIRSANLYDGFEVWGRSRFLLKHPAWRVLLATDDMTW
jgi:hypothetical protein